MVSVGLQTRSAVVRDHEREDGTVKLRNTLRVLLALTLLSALAACGDTWSGMKKDTGDNMETTGEAIDKAGEKVKTE
jgi:hypothetical protein